MKNTNRSEGRIKPKIKKLMPECAAVLICMLLLGFFVSCKEGYHMDELLSFELANAEFTPWIVPTQPVGRLEKFVVNEIRDDNAKETVKNLFAVIKDLVTNRQNSRLLSYTADVYEEPVWIDRQQFTDYITVGEDDGFNYLSVYFNVKDDNHPPFHFMLLHTISSVFRGCVTPAMGCVINMAAVAGILILLMKIAEIYADVFDIKSRRIFRISQALFYGLSAGAVATTLLIRMYALLTFFCVALFYIHLKKWQNKNFFNKNGMLILVTVLGFLTQYFFLFYCIALALVTCVIFLRDKEYKALLSYIRCMAAAACIGLLIFPFAISDVFSSTRGVEALENLSDGFAGYGSRLADFMGILLNGVGGVGVLVLTGLSLCIIVFTVIKRRRLPDNRKIQALCMLVIPELAYFLMAARLAPYMVDRYIMPLFPFAVFTIVFSIFMVCGDNRRISAVVAVLLAVFNLAGFFTYDGEYLYTGYSKQLEVADTYADTSCICVYAGVGYYENLIEFTKYEKTLLVTTDELSNRIDKDSITENDCMTVIVKYGAEVSDVEKIMMDEYGFTGEEILYSTENETSDTILRFSKDNF
jgi:hypothetical protein